ncbi:MAG TPA: glucokinase [Vicinamibacterales bacterium]|nr:glucokinase [Vicinamibacterales bacterium]
MWLAGDVGGTKSLAGLFTGDRDRPEPVIVREYVTTGFDSLVELVDAFIEDVGPPAVAAACFGVAGPITGQVARLTNVAWLADAGPVAGRLGCPVHLINDLVALATSVPVLDASELHVLQEGSAAPDGNAAVIAAGTGLGEAVLHNVDGRFVPSASEGGHADFAPRSAAEAAFVEHLRPLYGRVETERIVSGPGIVNAWGFTHASTDAGGRCRTLEGVDGAGAPAAVVGAAATRTCPACVEAVAIFVGAYGSEAGNLALRSAATAGVYIGGGIAPKILPWLSDGSFLEAFRDKPPLTDYLRLIPVSVILSPSAGLLGAAVVAAQAGASSR